MINPVQSFVNETNSRQEQMKNSANASNTNKILNDAKTMFQTGLNSTEPSVKNQYMSWSKINTLAWAILTYAESKGKYDDYADLQPAEIVNKFLEKNQWRGYDKYVNMYTWDNMDFDTLTKSIGINNNYNTRAVVDISDDEDFDPTLLSDYNPEDWETWFEEWNSVKGKKWGVWTAIWAWIIWGAYWVGKVLEPAWKRVYSQTFDPSINETRAEQRVLANEKIAQTRVKNAKADLKTAKATWEWIEGATKSLEAAQKWLESAKEWAKSFRGIADTAYDYNIGGGITEWWTPSSRGVDARVKANQIFEETLNPIFENSKSTLNVKEMATNLKDKLMDMAKWDPDKIKEYQEAYEELVKSFGGEEFEKMSPSAAQELKSWLQWRTPKKFFTWKNRAEREITDAYKEARALLSDEIKEWIYDIVKKEWKVDAAQLYRDYANLIEYADKQAAMATKWGLRGGAWSFVSTVYKAAWEPILQKGSLLTSKIWKALQYPVNKAISLAKSVWKNPKLLLKWLKAVAPWDLLMPDGKELLNNIQNDEYLNAWVERNWGDDFTEEEWMSALDENWDFTSLEEKWWTPEWFEVLLNILE